MPKLQRKFKAMIFHLLLEQIADAIGGLTIGEAVKWWNHKPVFLWKGRHLECSKFYFWPLAQSLTHSNNLNFWWMSQGMGGRMASWLDRWVKLNEYNLGVRLSLNRIASELDIRRLNCFFFTNRQSVFALEWSGFKSKLTTEIVASSCGHLCFLWCAS